MKNAASTEDIQEIKNLAHRLLTTYGHLKVDSAVTILEQLDSLDSTQVEPTKVNSLITDLTEINKELYKALKREMQKI